MLKQFLALQQDALEDQGQQLRKQQNHVHEEQQRQIQLTEYQETLTAATDQFNPLLRQNLSSMHDFVGNLIHDQHQKVQVEEQKLQTCRTEFRQSYAKVKGLERLQHQQEQAKELLEERRLRHTLDDLSCFQFSQKHRF